ncbi:MAG: LysR substrate-binding domain-containing protein [Tepidimonas sp.]|uniref:LysR family transcriptional regulator n=1 Tax=Tepidimonas sp. TaxID=2002775 RepID=UPI00298F29F5|nr:LysR substrate-binding domain-containing protein [Tepidimonas sp.]MCS6811539.1 LysR substrate-binding domain-containing protein [Tepidimonas sp.]MDW8336248.1 LysR substrate-binding domain-containing protein [Tepidimonas sp.]
MQRSSKTEWWGHVHWLTVLATQGSYTAAARRLGVSKAAVSQRIAELERAAGVLLVRRTTRSVRLTEAGQRLVEEVAGAYAQIEQGWARVRDLAGQPSGRVRLTAPVALARQVLVPLLAEFARAHPRVRLELDLSDRLVSLAAEGFDLAVRHTFAAPDTHVAWRLCATRSVLVAAADYLRTAGVPQHPLELAQHACLHYPRPGARALWTFEPVGQAAAAHRITVPVDGPLAANNSEALRDAALAGLGIALVPDFSARAAVQAGTLQEVLPAWRAVDVFAPAIWAIRPWSQHVPSAVAALVAHLRARLGAADQV